MTPELAVMLISGLGGLAGLGAVVNAFWQRRKIYAEAGKSGADSAQILSATAVSMLEPMHLQVTKLSSQLFASQGRVDSLDSELRAMNRELEATRYQVEQFSKIIEGLSAQLKYYNDKYGPVPS